MPTREAVVNAQIGNVLGVIHSLNPFLLYNPHRMEEGGLPTTAPKLDGETALAASATFIHACARLDAILTDNGRWDMAMHDELYKSIGEVNAAQKKFLDTQREAAAQILRPSFNLRPKLISTTTEFVAFWGDPMTPGASIIGHGPTAEDALKDFDAAFSRAPEQQIVSIAGLLGLSLDIKETAAPTQEEAPGEPTPAPEKKTRKKKR